MTENNAKLFGKMAQVMSKVRVLEKTGENKFDKYSYVTADAIATRLGSAMAEVGLAFFPSIVDVKTEDYATKSGGNNFRTVVHMQMTIACAESGATWTSDWFGEAIDRSDKSISKAAVSATKYFLLKTFLLAGGDEEDADAASPVVETRKQAPQPPAEPPAQGNRATTTPSTPHSPATQPTDDAGDEGTDGDELDKLHKQFHALGRELYSDLWDKVRARNAKRVSNGRTDSSRELTADEVQTIINGMKKLQQERVAA